MAYGGDQYMTERISTAAATRSDRYFFAFNTVNQISVWVDGAQGDGAQGYTAQGGGAQAGDARASGTRGGGGQGDGAALLDEVEALCERYERLFSRTAPQSGLATLNRFAGKPTTVDAELAALIRDALDYCAEVDGLFDVTMGTVVRLWDFNDRHIPSDEQLAEALSHVDYRRVHVDGTTVRLDDPHAALDLGGIAKGYIADKIALLLRKRGVESAIVNLGGNTFVLGRRPDKTLWRVGLRNPLPSTQQAGMESFARVEVENCSVVTSGIYERAFHKDGQLYHHILDPTTGKPAHTDLLGASLIARRSLDADGYTTGLIIMGLDRALAFIEGKPDLEAVFVTTAGEIYASSGIGTTIPFETMEAVEVTKTAT
jgi:thiamine biosynthesis lipoprotein